MDKNKTIEVLRKTLAKGHQIKLIDPQFPFSSHVQIDPENRKYLSNYLISEPKFQVFNGRLLWAPDSGTRVEMEEFINWLLRRSIEKGIEEAVEDLDCYFKNDNISGRSIVVLSGLETETEVDLCDDIKLIPFEALPESIVKHSLNRRRNSPDFFMRSLPKSALICDSPIPLAYRHKNDKDEPTYKNRQNELHDVCRSLTLVGPSAPHVIAQWWQPAEWVPLAIEHTSSWSSPGIDVEHFQSYKIESDADKLKAKAVCELFKQSSLKVKLKIPLDRLNLAIRRSTLIDKAIDLGIALESLFLDGAKTEIGLSLRLRGAWYLGDENNRDEVFNLLKTLYDYRSWAIHTGTLPPKVSTAQVNQSLQNGIFLAIQAIEKMLNENHIPEWNKLILGNTNTEIL